MPLAIADGSVEVSYLRAGRTVKALSTAGLGTVRFSTTVPPARTPRAEPSDCLDCQTQVKGDRDFTLELHALPIGGDESGRIGSITKPSQGQVKENVRNVL